MSYEDLWLALQVDKLEKCKLLSKHMGFPWNDETARLLLNAGSLSNTAAMAAILHVRYLPTPYDETAKRLIDSVEI